MCFFTVLSLMPSAAESALREQPELVAPERRRGCSTSRTIGTSLRRSIELYHRAEPHEVGLREAEATKPEPPQRVQDSRCVLGCRLPHSYRARRRHPQRAARHPPPWRRQLERPRLRARDRAIRPGAARAHAAGCALPRARIRRAALTTRFCIASCASTSQPSWRTRKSSYSASLPRYVTDAFERHLACGDFSRGFVRCHCDICKHDVLVAFSWSVGIMGTWRPRPRYKRA